MAVSLDCEMPNNRVSTRTCLDEKYWITTPNDTNPRHFTDWVLTGFELCLSLLSSQTVDNKP